MFYDARLYLNSTIRRDLQKNVQLFKSNSIRLGIKILISYRMQYSQKTHIAYVCVYIIEIIAVNKTRVRDPLFPSKKKKFPGCNRHRAEASVQRVHLLPRTEEEEEEKEKEREEVRRRAKSS